MSFSRSIADHVYPTTYRSSYRTFTGSNRTLPARNFNDATPLTGSGYSVSRSSSLHTPRAAPLPLQRSIPSRDYQQIFSQIAKITDHLYLSSLQAITLDRLRALGITLVVTAMNEPPPLRYVTDIATLHVPVEDIEFANLRPHFDRVADRIYAEQRRGGKTLVHCVAGISRSASLIIAYLIKYNNMTLREAFLHTRNRRQYIFPNMGFWRQLIEFEQGLFGGNKCSVKMINTDRGLLPDVVVDAVNSTFSTNRSYASSSRVSTSSIVFPSSASPSSSTVIGTSPSLRSFTFRPHYSRF